MHTFKINNVWLFERIFHLCATGGATVWPHAGVSVFPDKGDGIFWHNLFTDFGVDELTTHRACGVLFGSKWIANKWIGINAQWNTTRCSLHSESTFGNDILNSYGK